MNTKYSVQYPLVQKHVSICLISKLFYTAVCHSFILLCNIVIYEPNTNDVSISLLMNILDVPRLELSHDAALRQTLG